MQRGFKSQSPKEKVEEITEVQPQLLEIKKKELKNLSSKEWNRSFMKSHLKSMVLI